MRTAAFFDLDDTIINGNSGMRIVVHYFFKGKLSIFNAADISVKYFWYIIGRSKPFPFFRKLYKFLKGKDYKFEEKYCAEFFDKYISKLVYKEAKKRILWHKKRGHFVAIVTNSLEMMVKNITVKLYVDKLVASKLELKNGMITGRTRLISFGKNKAKIIKELAKKFDLDLKKSYAYSDNNSDIAMLSVVGKPYAVNPQRKMRKHAKKQNWKIMYFQDTIG